MTKPTNLKESVSSIIERWSNQWYLEFGDIMNGLENDLNSMIQSKIDELEEYLALDTKKYEKEQRFLEYCTENNIEGIELQEAQVDLVKQGLWSKRAGIQALRELLEGKKE